MLLVMRYFGVGSKKPNLACNNSCPDCSFALNRIERIFKDKVLHHLCFRIFDFKRYICKDCGWEGLKWEKKYSSSNK